ncbi:sulfite exporter TauE/SafE family protein [Phaeobacter sp. HF9A]|uniref:sulfite exporter TauE/SafE family protein n=1 Tax=Phaeobacter sp. HF9A TaxID=2721561 RepID=UPI0014303FDA|nr:sulfite exporter TauE/SafE family protein [Phaeobacter sp. HF9A]NIZ13111.1 sulfite exporter TauE/SafE family protein [Phaeobacter sp. HF9A]
MDLSLSFYVVATIAVLITGISKSGFGGGLGLMAVPLMSLFISPQFAAAVMMPILLAMDLLVVWRYRRHWDRRLVLALLPGALVGLGLGAYFFEALPADAVRLVVGVLALFFVVQFLLKRRQTAAPAGSGRLVPGILGALSGFSSYVAHAGSPPVEGYLLGQKLEKSAFVGTCTVYFFILNALKAVAYGASGAVGAQSLTVSLVLAPMLFLGVFAGTWLHSRVDQAVFVKIVYVFLAVTAAKLLYDSVPALFPALFAL